MTQKARSSDELHIRIIYGPLPPRKHEGQSTQFGVQDKKQEVHPGRVQKDGSAWFEFTVQLRETAARAQPDFGGPFVHGPRDGRFVYLSWKRVDGGPAPWIQRIKIPLSSITREHLRELSDKDGILQTDVSGRRPHSSIPVIWKVVR
jgi:hypothetical protein